MPHTLYLHTYSPIHIGSGETLEPGEYELSNSLYYRLDSDKLFGAILDQHPDAHDQVVNWIESQSERQERSSDNRYASRQRQETNFFTFVERELNDVSLARGLRSELHAYSRYYMPGPLALRGQVREQIKTATNELYVPGSSIKGALRTALLYEALRLMAPEKRRSLHEVLRKTSNVLRGRPKRKQLASLAQELENEFMGCGYRQGSKVEYGEPKFSLMRFLLVSDTEARPAHEIGRVVSADAYLVSGEKQSQIPPCEMIRESVTLPFRLTFDVATLRRIVEATLRRDRIKVGRDRLVMGTEVWTDLESKLDNVFGLTFADVISRTDEEIEKHIVERLLEASERFGEATAVYERRWADANRNGSFGESSRSMINRYDARPRHTLKIGWASGFPGITLFSLIVDWLDDRELQKPAAEILPKITGAKGQADTRTIAARFPKSRRFETRQGKVGLLGWVTLSLDSAHPAPQIIDEVAEELPTAETEPEAAFDPTKLPKIVKISKNTSGIPAEVVGHQGKALLVRLHAISYEKQTFTVGGVNGRDFAKGEWITVNVGAMSKKGKVVQVSFGGRLSKG